MRRWRHLNAPKELSVGFLPGDHLFKTLVADLRWPHFALSYQNYLKDQDLGNVAAISLGESIILYREKISAAGSPPWAACSTRAATSGTSTSSATSSRTA